MKRYTVYIRVNGEGWGEYRIVAKDRQSAGFIAGMKYQREESWYPGDYITCDIIPDPTGEVI